MKCWLCKGTGKLTPPPATSPDAVQLLRDAVELVRDYLYFPNKVEEIDQFLSRIDSAPAAEPELIRLREENDRLKDERHRLLRLCNTLGQPSSRIEHDPNEIAAQSGDADE